MASPLVQKNCVLLQRIMLPYTLQTIHSKAFMNCAALQELAIPPSLHLHCLQSLLGLHVLRGCARMPGKRTTWRGTYAEETAFALCPGWRLPQCRKSTPMQSDCPLQPAQWREGESGVVTTQRPTCPHLHTPSELTQARTLALDLWLRAPVG